MAFHIRSRIGWHRLWLVAVLVWTMAMATTALVQFPTRDYADSQLEKELSRLTPEAVAAHNESIAATKRAEVARYGVSRDYQTKLLTPEKVSAETMEAHEWHGYRLESLKRERKQLLLQGTALWLLPCILLYLAGWLIAWIIRGFTLK